MHPKYKFFAYQFTDLLSLICSETVSNIFLYRRTGCIHKPLGQVLLSRSSVWPGTLTSLRYSGILWWGRSNSREAGGVNTCSEWFEWEWFLQAHTVRCLVSRSWTVCLERRRRRCVIEDGLWVFKSPCQPQLHLSSAYEPDVSCQLFLQCHACLPPCFLPWWLWTNPLKCKQDPIKCFKVVLVMMSLHNNRTGIKTANNWPSTMISPQCFSRKMTSKKSKSTKTKYYFGDKTFHYFIKKIKYHKPQSFKYLERWNFS